MKTELTGFSFVQQDACGAARMVHAIDPVTLLKLAPGFCCARIGDARLARELAEQAQADFARLAPVRRADLLDAVAAQVVRIDDALTARLMLETGLGHPWASTEVSLLAAQYRRMAAALRAQAAAPVRESMPVAVFGSDLVSLSLSVAGLQTLAALAAGRAVIAVADPGLSGTSAMLGGALQRAVGEMGLPPGVFSLLMGCGDEHVRDFLEARDPAAHSGRVRRSFHPMYVLPQALNARAEKLAEVFIAQGNDAGGQSALHGGILVAVMSAGFIDLKEATMEATDALAASHLKPGSHARYMQGATRLMMCGGVDQIGEGVPGSALWSARALLFQTNADTILQRPDLLTDIDGPIGLLVGCASTEQMLDVAAAMTAPALVTMFADTADTDLASRIQAAFAGPQTRFSLNPSRLDQGTHWGAPSA